MKLAVIGAGAIGKRHLEAAGIMDGLHAVAVVERSKERAAEMVDAFGVRAYDDVGEMLAEQRPDITVVALPHHLHKDVAIQCAAHGSHLLLEKPMALSTAECDEMMEAAARHQVKLLVGHTQHYIAENIEAKRIIASGELGTLLAIADVRHVPYYRDDRPAWFFERAKAGGGIMMNLGSHSIDKVQWLTDSWVKTVKASLHYGGGRGDIEGSGVLFAQTSSGVAATITQSGYSGVSRDQTEFIFTNGMMRLETGRSVSISRNGVYEPVVIRQKEPSFVLQFRDLMAAIETNSDPSCTGVYSRSIIATLEAMYRSHETGTEQHVAHPVSQIQ